MSGIKCWEKEKNKIALVPAFMTLIRGREAGIKQINTQVTISGKCF